MSSKIPNGQNDAIMHAGMLTSIQTLTFSRPGNDSFKSPCYTEECNSQVLEINIPFIL